MTVKMEIKKSADKGFFKKTNFFRTVSPFCVNKSAFLIASTRVDSDIKKNAVFTPDNAGLLHYTCSDRVRACPLLYGYIRFWANNAGTPHVPIGTVDKGLTFLPRLTGAHAKMLVGPSWKVFFLTVINCAQRAIFWVKNRCPARMNLGRL